MKTPVLYLTVGYPGAGKTTASRILHTVTGAVHIWADHERKRMFAHPTYTHRENLELYAALNQETGRLLREGKSVIFDTNFNFYKDREKLRQIASQYGAHTMVVWVTTPKEVARERATKDAHKQHTRVLGDMPVEHFERIARNLEPPRENENVLTLDGTHLNPPTIAEMLTHYHMTRQP